MRENLIKEKHIEGMDGHFGQDKTISIIRKHYLWPRLSKDVKKFVQSCRVCYTTKGISQNTGLCEKVYCKRMCMTT